MATTLPVTFRGAPLNPEFNGNLQQLFDAFVERLSIESQEDLSFFVSGNVAPTSDVGPWLKNSITWYVWDVNTGAYIPQIIEFESLRYIAQQNEPDPAKYVFWIRLDVNGKAQGIHYYYSGAWVDVYDDIFALIATRAEMNAAIAAAVTIGNRRYPVSAYMSGTAQSVPIDGTPYKLNFNATAYSPDGIFDPGPAAYTVAITGYYRVSAHVQVENDTGDPTGMELSLRIGVNGNSSQTTCFGGTSVASPPGDRWYPSFSGGIRLNAGDVVSIFLMANDGTNTGLVNCSNADFAIELIQVPIP